MEESVTRLRYRGPNYRSGVSNCPGMKFFLENEFAAQREVKFKALRGTELRSAAGDISLCSIRKHPSVIQEPSGSGGTDGPVDGSDAVQNQGFYLRQNLMVPTKLGGEREAVASADKDRNSKNREPSNCLS